MTDSLWFQSDPLCAYCLHASLFASAHLLVYNESKERIVVTMRSGAHFDMAPRVDSQFSLLAGNGRLFAEFLQRTRGMPLRWQINGMPCNPYGDTIYRGTVCCAAHLTLAIDDVLERAGAGRRF